MKTRVLSAIVMLLILIPVLIIGGELFALAVAFVGCIALRELLHLKRKDKNVPFITEIMAYLATLYLILTNYNSCDIILKIDYRFICFSIFAFLIPTVLVGDNKKYSFKEGFYLLGSTLLVGFGFNLLILIRNYSLLTLIYLLLITILTDTFALVTGMFIGKHKLCEKVSPKKTVEGLIGGTFMGVFTASVFYLTFINPDVAIMPLLIVTISLSLIGQLGDLVFSQIKREFGVKDFSNLIPGHGGILDRVDSILFVLLMYTLFITII